MQERQGREVQSSRSHAVLAEQRQLTATKPVHLNIWHLKLRGVPFVNLQFRIHSNESVTGNKGSKTAFSFETTDEKHHFQNGLNRRVKIQDSSSRKAS